MEVERIRLDLERLFKQNDITKNFINAAHIILIIASVCLLLSNIRMLNWLYFGGATLLLCELSLIFAFIAKKYKYLFVGMIILILDKFIDLFQNFSTLKYYYGSDITSAVMRIIGQIFVIVIFVLIFVQVYNFVKSTGDISEMKEMMQAGVDRAKQQVNESMSNIKGSINNHQNQGYAGVQSGYQQYSQYPPEYKPISALGYIGYSFLFAIPLIGFILLLVFSFGGTTNKNLKNYARSYFCFFILAIILFIIIAGIAGGIGLFTASRYY